MTRFETWATDDPERRIHKTEDEDRIRAALEDVETEIDRLRTALEEVCNVGDLAAVRVARAALPPDTRDREDEAWFMQREIDRLRTALDGLVEAMHDEYGVNVVYEALKTAASYPAEMEVNRERWRAAATALRAALATARNADPAADHD